MTDEHQTEPLLIKKYSNRRFYNATHRKHVTLGEMHELIQNGQELRITDSKTGEDITNVVLTQIILDRDAPKLEIFPANVLHEMIRTQREFLGSVVERFFAQVLETHKNSQEQWMGFLRNTLGTGFPGATTNPMDWARNFMAPFMPPSDGRNTNDRDQHESGDKDEIDALRKQVAELSSQIDRMANGSRE